MKFLFAILFSGFLLTISSCSKNINGSGMIISEDRAVDVFSGIETDGPFEIEIVKSVSYSLALLGEENILPLIEARVVNGILKLGFRQSGSLPRHAVIRIKVCTPVLHQLLVSGSGIVNSKEEWETSSLFIKVLGNGKLDLNFRVNKLKTHVSGSGQLNLSGHCHEADYSINGSGKLAAFSLKTRLVTGSIKGFGSCELSVDEQLNGSISGNGSLLFRGNPSIVNVTVSGKGRLAKENI